MLQKWQTVWRFSCAQETWRSRDLPFQGALLLHLREGGSRSYMFVSQELHGLLSGSNQAPAKLPGKRGWGDTVSYPKSYMDSCQDPTKLQLSFQVRVEEEALCSYLMSYLDSCQDPTKLQLSFQEREIWRLCATIPVCSYLDSCQDPTKLQLSFQVREDEEILLCQELTGLLPGSSQASAQLLGKRYMEVVCSYPGATWPLARTQPSSNSASR